MLNQVVLIGRLCKDPELRYIPGTEKAVTTINLAVDRNYKNKNGEKITDFFFCDCFGKTAEFVVNYLVKGRLVAVQGEVHIDRYQDGEGKDKSSTKISVASIKALDKKSDSSNSNQSVPPASDPPGFQALDDDDIPF